VLKPISFSYLWITAVGGKDKTERRSFAFSTGMKYAGGFDL
jgi:hypothetical protein